MTKREKIHELEEAVDNYADMIYRSVDDYTKAALLIAKLQAEAQLTALRWQFDDEMQDSGVPKDSCF